VTIGSPSTKKCPTCAEEIEAAALVCRFCGTRFAVELLGYCPSCHRQVTIGDGHACPECGTAVVDEIRESRLREDEPDTGRLPPPLPPRPPPPAAGEVREGIVGSLRMKIGEIMAALSIAAMILTSAFAFGEIESLAWAERAIGLRTELAQPALAFVLGAVVAALVAAIAIRPLVPRARDVGAAAKRKYRRRLRDEYGLGSVYVRRGMRGSVITLVVLLIGIGGIVLYNIDKVSGDADLEPAFGIYLALILTAVAIIGSLLMWPFRSAEVVLMDGQGGIHRST